MTTTSVHDSESATKTNEADSEPKGQEQTRVPGLSSTVHTIADYLRRGAYEGGISTGDLAELRRLDPREPYTSALWKILLRSVPEKHRRRPEDERNWAILLMAMGTCAGLHNPTVRFGAALAQAGWLELRFVRLLQARGDKLAEELRRLANFLASNHQEANWADAAWLLFDEDGDDAQHRRQNLARHYYRRKYALENKSSS